MKRATEAQLELYNQTVKRFSRIGIKSPMELIIALAEEIERYRDKIYWLEEHQRNDEQPATTAAQSEPMTREKILDAAKRGVCGDREEDYGSPEQNFQTIANLWADYLQGRGVNIDFLEPHDVAAMLSLLKIARISSGHGKADNWVDLAGYAACGGELEG